MQDNLNFGMCNVTILGMKRRFFKRKKTSFVSKLFKISRIYVNDVWIVTEILNKILKYLSWGVKFEEWLT